MSKLLRLIPKGNWAQLINAPEWADNDCPEVLLKQLVAPAGTGLSVWRISDQWDVARTIAAQAMSQKSVSDVTYLLMDEAEVRKAKIAVRQENADTVDNEVDKTHCNLTNITANKAATLARIMVFDCAPETFDKKEIYRTAVKYFISGIFDRSIFIRHQQKKDAQVLGHMLRDRYLDFVLE